MSKKQTNILLIPIKVQNLIVCILFVVIHLLINLPRILIELQQNSQYVSRGCHLVIMCSDYLLSWDKKFLLQSDSVINKIFVRQAILNR